MTGTGQKLTRGRLTRGRPSVVVLFFIFLKLFETYSWELLSAQQALTTTQGATFSARHKHTNQQHTNANRTHMHRRLAVRRLASLKRAQMQQMMHGRI